MDDGLLLRRSVSLCQDLHTLVMLSDQFRQQRCVALLVGSRNVCPSVYQHLGELEVPRGNGR